MHRSSPRSRPSVRLAVAGAMALLALAPGAASAARSPSALQEEDAPVATDYLTFAQGAMPVSVEVVGTGRPVGFEEAVAAIDGNPVGFTMVSVADADTRVELIYALPAPTVFERFAVPGVFETPSPGQTFFRNIEIHGSTEGPDRGWEPLAAAELSTHESRGMVTEIPVTASPAVRWLKVALSGGIEVLRDTMFLEFSELIGNGSQEIPALADDFRGIWQGRGVLVELKQDGATVNGCIDREGNPFEGTVTANILRGRAIDPDSQVVSLLIAMVAEDGQLRGVRSDNGAPFRVFEGDPAPAGTTTSCSEGPEPTLGCGSVIHGINFDYDSAAIRPDSAPVLQSLFEGLQAAPDATVVIEGHTSSEGSSEYNLDLSERRARAVVDELVRRGIGAGRIDAVGRGEAAPIANNDTESGRALNRRVEVHCGGGQ